MLRRKKEIIALLGNFPAEDHFADVSTSEVSISLTKPNWAKCRGAAEPRYVPSHIFGPKSSDARHRREVPALLENQIKSGSFPFRRRCFEHIKKLWGKDGILLGQLFVDVEHQQHDQLH